MSQCLPAGEYNLHICNVGEGTRDKCSTYIIEYSNDHFYLDEKFKKFRYLEDLIENYKGRYVAKVPFIAFLAAYHFVPRLLLASVHLLEF